MPKQRQSASTPRVVGASSNGDHIRCFFTGKNQKNIFCALSTNAEDFYRSAIPFRVSPCLHLSCGRIDQGDLMLLQVPSGLKLYIHRQDHPWQLMAGILLPRPVFGAVVPEFQIDGHYLMVLGGESLHFLKSLSGKKWQEWDLPVELVAKRSDQTIAVDLAYSLPQGILIVYRLQEQESLTTAQGRQQVYAMLLDRHDPQKVLWRSSSLWESSADWGEAEVGGTVIFRSQIFAFWNTSAQGILLIRYPLAGVFPTQLGIDRKLRLAKSGKNPILCPRSRFPWESFATYNPAVFYADDKIHILYRAQGDDLVSSIGYAVSEDGVHLQERLSAPVFSPQEVFESPVSMSTGATHAQLSQVPSPYSSGGGIAGCEDPRATVIDQRVYMTYVAYDGANPPRIALTSIGLDDFLAQRWLWQRPVLISPPGIVDKSAVIFPEKIGGKYVIMHRIFPDILIDFVDDLNFDGSQWLEGQYRISPRHNMWDSRKIGAGAPPIKTPDGWLLIYYGVDDRDDRTYKIGAMLLDLEDPTKVICRPDSPILEPEEWYENSGFKPGVAYPCGAVVLREKLLVYYGGADSVVCVASAILHSFLRQMKSNDTLRPALQPIRHLEFSCS